MGEHPQVWCRKLAELYPTERSVVWFSPGLTYGTDGLADKPPLQRWFMETVLFGMMRLFGKAQSPRDGVRKYADCIEGKIGRHGDIIGAPEGQALGELVDQIPMNSAFDDAGLRDAFWGFTREIWGPFGASAPAAS